MVGVDEAGDHRLLPSAPRVRPWFSIGATEEVHTQVVPFSPFPSAPSPPSRRPLLPPSLSPPPIFQSPILSDALATFDSLSARALTPLFCLCPNSRDPPSPSSPLLTPPPSHRTAMTTMASTLRSPTSTAPAPSATSPPSSSSSSSPSRPSPCALLLSRTSPSRSLSLGLMFSGSSLPVDGVLEENPIPCHCWNREK